MTSRPTLCPKCEKQDANEPHSCPLARAKWCDDDPEYCERCDDCTHECHDRS